MYLSKYGVLIEKRVKVVFSLVFLADLQKLQKAAVIASNAYRKTSTYLQSIRKGNYKNETSNDAEITQAYWKARYDFDNGT
ncbi:unnamed protein product, partial [Trichobilharzia szidati]